MLAPYRLTRTYSIASFIGIAVIAVVLVMFYRAIATEALKESEALREEALAQKLSITLWPQYQSFIRRATAIPIDQLARQPEIASLKQDVAKEVRGLAVVKVKIYDLGGLTVFSSEEKQIGEQKGDNLGYQSARAGKVATELTFRNQFSAFEQVIADRNLVSSYIPARSQEGGPVEGVFEIYSDVTPLVKQIEQTGYIIMAGVIVLLLMLYFFLLLFVRRAEKIIHKHEEQEYAAQQARIHRLSHYDELTDLPNRVLFVSNLEQAILRAQEGKFLLGLIVVDLDRFKAINDTLGQAAGDAVLKEAVRRLHGCVRSGEMIGRLSGNQFALMLENLLSPDFAVPVAARMVEVLSQAMQAGDESHIVVSPSIGIALFPQDAMGGENKAEGLMKAAIAALQSAKQKGGNRYVFHTHELSERVTERIELEHELRHALQNGEFMLYYQPIISHAANRIIGAEALIRWQHPKRGLLTPGYFIHLLEETGLVVSVGEWVIQEACRQCKKWQDAGYGSLYISANLSLKQMNPALVADVRRALEISQLPAQYLNLEITESVLAENKEDILDILRELKKIGVKLSIDDFGTGYSSLSYIKHFPVDCLKIDRAFVHDVTRNREHAAIIRAITAMAGSLDIGLVAEGIETREELDFLLTTGCDAMQGYLFSKPVPAADFSALLARGAPLAVHPTVINISDYRS